MRSFPLTIHFGAARITHTFLYTLYGRESQVAACLREWYNNNKCLPADNRGIRLSILCERIGVEKKEVEKALNLLKGNTEIYSSMQTPNFFLLFPPSPFFCGMIIFGFTSFLHHLTFGHMLPKGSNITLLSTFEHSPSFFWGVCCLSHREPS